MPFGDRRYMSSVCTCNVNVRMLDLDLIAEWDEWLVVEPPMVPVIERSAERLNSEPGTVVIWRKLDACCRRSAPRADGRAVGSTRWRLRPPSI